MGILTPWTEAEGEEVAQLWRDGVSASEIGRIIGRTKGSIIGWIARNGHQYGLSKRITTENRERGRFTGSAVERAPNVENIRRRLALQDIPLPAPKPLPPMEWTPARVPLEALERRSCRFPLWPHMAKSDHADYGYFCGLEVDEGETYCPRCRKVCIHPVQPKGIASLKAAKRAERRVA